MFLAPWLIGVVVFLLGPIIASVWISLTSWNIISEAQWVGLDNYREMFFDDPKFWQSIKVTLYFTVLAVPLGLACGLALSLLLNMRLRGMYAYRTILYLPSVISGVAVAVLWSSLLNPDLGAVNVLSARHRRQTIRRAGCKVRPGRYPASC